MFFPFNEHDRMRNGLARRTANRAFDCDGNLLGRGRILRAGSRAWQAEKRCRQCDEHPGNQVDMPPTKPRATKHYWTISSNYDII